jgi:hypothetical protein
MINLSLGNLESNKKYRFFYHYYRQYNTMSIHFKDCCYKAKNVICEVPTETKWNDTQPNLIIRGFCKSVEIKGDIAYIK